MNKEEKKFNNHTRNQRRMFRIKKQEEKINDLKLLVGNLQSQLDQANKKLDKIKELVNKYGYYTLSEIPELLSIIDMNNKEKLDSSEGE